MARALLVLAAALLRPTSGGNSTSGTTHPSCLNSAGEAVDYWVALKLPNGAITYESYGGALKKSASGMDGTSGNLIVNTVQQIYKMKDSSAVGVALYNDETDAGVESASHAHSKGVVAFDTTQGFWLVHSLPRYPNHRSKGYGPLPTVTYGQSWLCMTLKTATFEDVGTQLQVTGPLFYDTHLSSTLTTKLPAFAAAIAGTTSGVATSTKTIHTKGGAVFYHLAKSKAWGKELYDDLVAPKYGDLFVETWMNGVDSNKIPSSCTQKGFKNEVLDVTNYTLDDTVWTETQDHSKWAIAQKSKTVCIGDINRQKSQSLRGGGTVCHSSSSIWSSFRAAITGVQACT